jgi:hypothetical protein
MDEAQGIFPGKPERGFDRKKPGPLFVLFLTKAPDHLADVVNKLSF